MGVDLLINNAGVIHVKQVLTRFGDDEQLAINYLGPYLLTEGLLPLIEQTHGRVVYVSCSAHAAVEGNVVQTYLSGRGVWSPRVADKFDGLEQFGFTKLGNIYHAQQLAVRSYPAPAKQSLAARLVAQKDPKYAAATPQLTAAELSLKNKEEDHFTSCACTPGGVATRLFRNVPFADIAFSYLRYGMLLMMRTPSEGSQTVVNACLRDELYNGGYYMNCRYEPSGLSGAACSVQERNNLMNWTHKKMSPYMKWD
ncbi:short chain dehydrogenase/reductase [Angomonas deanei]|nr:short chain dehydrogenase/reductase [Angomonas deanei]|eukprot:EPY41872.1 short chain dehydrogenase/reductase [Angomonas deanei]